MAREQYRKVNFRKETVTRIRQVTDILSEYRGQRLTARQVYYQLVARGFIENNERSYKNTTNLLADMRYAGIVDWNTIEDRGREPEIPSEWDSVAALGRGAARGFRLPRWAGQPNYVELWVEKQALAGVLSPIAYKWHVPLMVNKGYSSASAMKAAAERMLERTGIAVVYERIRSEGGLPGEEESEEWREAMDKWSAEIQNRPTPIVIYLGDHDPSGEDMVRDIQDRLEEFRVATVEVKKIALTMDQIDEFNPPPNPAKITDSRARAYIDKFGEHSWELDALPPRELNRLVEESIQEHMDMDAYDKVLKEEKKQLKRFTKAMEEMEKDDE